MDETGLYWKMTPSRGLSIQSQPGRKKEKARISLVFCVNAAGTDRTSIWAIGQARRPRALRGVCLSTMGIQWRANKTAWMNTTIMAEWLQAFYLHIGSTRQILLTMDNFSAHYTGLELAPPPSNIRICWLPANSTSRYQPLDQGIINSFKAHYRRQWLSYMLQAFEQDQDPLITMNIRLALRWVVRSWYYYITNTTIYNCFRKSTLIPQPITLPTPIEPVGLAQLYEDVVRTGRIHDSMVIKNFLNPIEELEAEEDQGIEGQEEENQDILVDRLLQELLQDHLSPQQGQDDEEEEQVGQPIPSIQAAIDALKVLIDFAEGSDGLQTDQLRLLERLEGQLEVLKQNRYIQGTLDTWIT